MNTPLVTIGLITYNSAEFIEETLNSIYKQDYENLELIVSDDCSTDNTVDLCRTWLSKYDSRFKRVKLITSEKNTGLSGNSNRAFNEAQGEWYKSFDGDDIMASNAISSYVQFINDHPEARQVCARVRNFNSKAEWDSRKIDLLTRFVCRGSATAKTQLPVITKTLFFRGTSHFARTDVIKSVGAFDERFPMLEDHPLFIRLIGAGFKVYFIDKPLVKYRVRDDSTAHSAKGCSIFTDNIIRQYLDYGILYRVEYCSSFWKSMSRFSIRMIALIKKHGNNHSLCCRFLDAVFRLIDPIIWSNRFLYIKAFIYNLAH